MILPWRIAVRFAVGNQHLRQIVDMTALREVGLPAFIAAISGKIDAAVAGNGRASAPNVAQAAYVIQPCHRRYGHLAPTRNHGEQKLLGNYRTYTQSGREPEKSKLPSSPPPLVSYGIHTFNCAVAMTNPVAMAANWAHPARMVLGPGGL